MEIMNLIQYYFFEDVIKNYYEYNFNLFRKRFKFYQTIKDLSKKNNMNDYIYIDSYILFYKI